MRFGLVHRIMTDALAALGVGDAVSKELVQGMARIGNGLSQFITETERMEKKASHLFL